MRWNIKKKKQKKNEATSSNFCYENKKFKKLKYTFPTK